MVVQFRKKDAQVLVVVGNEHRDDVDDIHWIEGSGAWLLYDLRRVLGYRSKQVTTLSGRRLGTTGTRDAIAQYMQALHPQTPVLLVYHGHGNLEGIAPDGTTAIPYSELVQMCQARPNLLFVNNSCYAGAAIEPFQEAGLLESRVEVLASSQPAEASWGDLFLMEVMNSSRAGRRYSPKRLVAQRAQVPVASGGYVSERRHQHPVRAGADLGYLLAK